LSLGTKPFLFDHSVEICQEKPVSLSSYQNGHHPQSPRRATMQLQHKRTLLYSLLLILVAVVGFKFLTAKPEPTHRRAHTDPSRNVELQRLHYGEQKVEVFSLGRVRGVSQIPLTARVSGTLLWTAGEHGLRTGLQLEQGDLLALIDTADVVLDRSSLESQLLLAQEQLLYTQSSLALAQKDVARLEELLNKGLAGEQALEAAQKQLLSVQEKEAGLQHQTREGGQLQSALAKAALQYDRCFVRAPFDLEILKGDWNVGALINPGTILAHVLERNRLEVRIQIPAQDAVFLEAGIKGLRVDLLHPETDDLLGYAKIEHLSQAISPEMQTREALLSVEEAGSMLLPGMLVKAALLGPPLPHTFRLPRRVLREDGRLLVYRAGKLAFAHAVVLFRGEDYALLADGPSEGDSLVISPIQLPVEGAPLQVLGAVK
jgi:multidrug efflux pump subunit AcrA (membrane-fusion protein)